MAKVSSYLELMKKIPYMEKYMSDVPEIFDESSPKFLNFLTESFSHLHSSFNHLQFLSAGEIRGELLKASLILHLHPLPPKGNQQNKLFENLSASDIHKFWTRFFLLFETKSNVKDNVMNSNNASEMLQFMSDVKQSHEYFNYEFPVINASKVSHLNVNSHISSWISMVTSECKALQSEIHEHSDLSESSVEIDVHELVKNISYIQMKYKGVVAPPIYDINVFESFFTDFNSAAEVVTKYKSEVNSINLQFLENIPQSEDDSPWLQLLSHVKRCNNLLLKIKLKKERKHAKEM